MNWKPIASAPKDGTLILAWNRIWGVPVAVRWQKGSTAPWRSEVGCLFFEKNTFQYWRENIAGPVSEIKQKFPAKEKPARAEPGQVWRRKNGAIVKIDSVSMSCGSQVCALVPLTKEGRASAKWFTYLRTDFDYLGMHNEIDLKGVEG